MQNDKVKADASKTNPSSAERRCGAIIFLTMRRIATTTVIVARHPNTTAVVTVECSDKSSLPSCAVVRSDDWRASTTAVCARKLASITPMVPHSDTHGLGK